MVRKEGSEVQISSPLPAAAHGKAGTPPLTPLTHRPGTSSRTLPTTTHFPTPFYRSFLDPRLDEAEEEESSEEEE